MAELTELSKDKHRELKVAKNCAIGVAAQQHVINIKAIEVGRAVSSLPVFLSRLPDSGEWAISAVTGLEIGDNLFVTDGEWKANYMPIAMQTYPFFLMKAPDQENGYTIGIDEESEFFSSSEGEALFDDDGKATPLLSEVTLLLKEEVNNELNGYHFANKLEELGLVRSIDVKIMYQEGKVNTLTGLNTIDEDRLAALTTEQFEELRMAGYLPPIYAMLMSIYQLNSLIHLHNNRDGANKVAQIKMEVSKDAAA